MKTIGGVIVRPVKLSDVSDLRENCFSMNTLEQVQSRIEAKIQEHEEQKGLQLVAEVDGLVVGTAGIKRNPHPLEAHRAELVDLVVHGDYRQQGSAHRLVEEYCVHGVALGIEILEAGCRTGTPAEKVYPRLGFIEWGRLPRGIIESWGEHRAYGLLYFYRPLVHVSES